MEKRGKKLGKKRKKGERVLKGENIYIKFASMFMNIYHVWGWGKGKRNGKGKGKRK